MVRIKRPRVNTRGSADCAHSTGTPRGWRQSRLRRGALLRDDHAIEALRPQRLAELAGLPGVGIRAEPDAIERAHAADHGFVDLGLDGAVCTA